ncbi:MAG: fluoride efflux transporter CrcB [Zetaproteobacteria bacterium]|nr:MAG: fluoride efflux transporter CrcB [Zetaproteobacteria bacterium]
MIREMLAIAAGGAVGAVLRWLAASAVQRLSGGAFPWGTLFVNALGSLLLGFLFVWLIERSSAGELARLALTVGFLGAFTTFSTFSLESVRLLQEGALGLALANVLAQVVLCLVLAWLGVQLARLL